VLNSTIFFATGDDVVRQLKRSGIDISSKVEKNLKCINENAEQILASNYWLLIHISYNYAKAYPIHDVMDFIQEASIKGLRAAQKYDPHVGRFKKYLAPTVRTAIKRYMIKQKANGLFSQTLVKSKHRIWKKREMEKKNGESLDDKELAEYLGLKKSMSSYVISLELIFFL